MKKKRKKCINEICMHCKWKWTLLTCKNHPEKGNKKMKMKCWTRYKEVKFAGDCIDSVLNQQWCLKDNRCNVPSFIRTIILFYSIVASWWISYRFHTVCMHISLFYLFLFKHWQNYKYKLINPMEILACLW